MLSSGVAMVGIRWAAWIGVLLVCAECWAQTATGAFTVYNCKSKSCQEIAQLLRPLIPESDPGIELVVDADRNRLLLTGPPFVHKIAADLLEKADRPASRPASGLSFAPTKQLKSYRVPTGSPAAWSLQIKQQLGNGPRISTDAATDTLFISASSDEHAVIDRMLSQAGNGTSQIRDNRSAFTPVDDGTARVDWRTADSASPNPIAPEVASATGLTQATFIRIPTRQFDRLQQQLVAIFGTRLAVQDLAGRRIFVLKTVGKTPGQLEIEFDQSRSGVLVGGTDAATRQFLKLVESLSAPGRVGQGTRAFSLRRENHSQVREVIESGRRLGPPQGRVGRVIGPVRPRVQRLPNSSAGDERYSEIQPTRFLYDENQDPNVTLLAQADVPPAVQGGEVGPVRQFEGVDIESLPELDVIILRGTDQDLDQLADIISQLERISKETQPVVRVYPLEFSQSSAVTDIVQEVSGDLVAGRQGKVSVTPLVKPNSILIIGWGDAVQATEELIRQLDKPVAPESQSEVFRLKYATASVVQQTLQGFFANRGGLGPRVQIATDAATNSLIVYAAPRDLDEVRKLLVSMDLPNGESVDRARIFQIENALAADLAQTLQQAVQAAANSGERSAILELLDADGKRILQSGTLRGVQITPNVRNNTLIVSGPSGNLDLVAELIRQLDTPAGQAKIKVFRIVNGDAASLVQTLRSLIPSQAAGGTSGPQISATGEAGMTPLRFSVDSRSNSIIATGAEGDLRIVEALLVKLDQTTSMQRKTAVYRLRNSPAIDVANAVNQYLFNRRQLESAVPGQGNPFAEIEREVVVVPEPIANKLILAATPRYFEEIQRLIEKLDESPPQVMIQVLIAEVALNQADEFGVELGLQDSVLFDRSLLGDLLTTSVTTQNSTPAGIVTATQEIIQAASNIPGFAFNSTQPLGNSGSESALSNAGAVGGQGISNFAVGRSNEQLGFGGMVLSASSKNVSILLRALRESRRVDVLSRPQIRTLDNQPAYIQVGQRVPRIVGSTVNQNGQSNSVTLENVGLILGVTPRVSPDGTVVMEIDAEKSALGPEQEGIPVAVSIDGTVIRSPRVDTTTAQATVSAADGETIVLGGLITENGQYVHRSVPILGDIPIIEHFFRYDGKFKRRTELLIILTPHIIRTPEDSERLRQVEMARMSWCACDVYRLMDDIDYFPESNLDRVDIGQPDVIYPDLNPTGDLEELLPPEPVGSGQSFENFDMPVVTPANQNPIGGGR